MEKQEPEEVSTPQEERKRIGTPAGESPEKGRRRHKTRCLTDVCPADSELKSVNAVDDVEDYDETQEEIATTGGITGTKVKESTPGAAMGRGAKP